MPSFLMVSRKRTRGARLRLPQMSIISRLSAAAVPASDIFSFVRLSRVPVSFLIVSFANAST